MKEYMLIFRNEKNEAADMPSAEQMKNALEQWQSWIRGIVQAGKLSGTNRLLPEGKTVRPGKLVTDGPHMEVKEMIGGYVIVKAKDIDEAISIAFNCPNIIYGGTVEVRAVMQINTEVKSGKFLEQQSI